MKQKTMMSLVFGALIIVVMLTSFTSPATIHPIGLLGVFICLYILSFGVMTALLYLLQFVQITIKRYITVKPIGYTYSHKTYLYASVLAFAPIAFLASRSIGGSGFYDVLLIIIFELLACFYIWKST